MARHWWRRGLVRWRVIVYCGDDWLGRTVRICLAAEADMEQFPMCVAGHNYGSGRPGLRRGHGRNDGGVGCTFALFEFIAITIRHATALD